MRNLPSWLQQRLDELQDGDFVRCRDWLASLSSGTLERLEEASPPTGLGNDPDLLRRDLQVYRSKLARLNVEMRHLSKSRPSSDLRVKAEHWVQRRASTLTVDTSNGRCEPTFEPNRAIALLCLIAPDAVTDAIVRFAGSGGLAADRARQQEVSRIKSELRMAEQCEEEIIRRLLENGIASLRRADENPAIILGVDVSSVQGRIAA